MTVIVSGEEEREYMQIPIVIICKGSQCLKTGGNGLSVIKRISEGLALGPSSEGGHISGANLQRKACRRLTRQVSNKRPLGARAVSDIFLLVNRTAGV